jgi:glyoxylase-like metal-dependent hydrolase (beta-lactamase superfamily II)
MIQIHTLPLGPLQTNCFVVHKEASKVCAVIDPGEDFPKLWKFLQAKDLAVEAILLTHGHFDHVGSVEELVKHTGCSVWQHEADWAVSYGPLTSNLFPIAQCTFTPVHLLKEGDTVQAAGMTFSVLHTPGHTRGSACFALEDKLFTGDTLFAGACGRTDLPGGGSAAMMFSLERLADLPVNYEIYPGHGESTTLAMEKQYNPYLRQHLL